MKPVWIKYYGIIPMTKYGYLIALAVAGGIAAVFTLGAAVAGFMPPLDTMWSGRHRIPDPGVGAWFYNYCYWLILVCLVAEAIDTFAVLRTFAKKEQEQRFWLAAQEEGFAEERPARLGIPETKAGERRPPDSRHRLGG